MTWPAYHSLAPSALRERARRGISVLTDCRACPRDCGIDRAGNQWSACLTGRHAVVNSYFAHFGEEDCLRGWNGSGTIFFSGCNLRCVFCQNAEISWNIKPGRGHALEGSSPATLADMMLELQGLGCHNINFVTPEHVVPQIVEALPLAVEQGLRLPIVYNTSAYDGFDSLELIDGLVDIYMPDFKFWTEDRSRTYLKAADYPETARAAVKEMHRQVGDLVVDSNGLARRGLLIRHLVMPGQREETRAILEWIATEIGPKTYVNLMDQYGPSGKVSAARYAEINRRTTTAEFREARALARDLGLRLDTRRPHPRPYPRDWMRV